MDEGKTPEEALAALETINRFYLAVTDYFRDGQPSRLMPRIYELGMPTSRAMDVLRAHLEATHKNKP